MAPEQGKWADGPTSKPVWPEVVDVAGLSLSELRARLGLIERSEARLVAVKTVALAEYSSQPPTGAAQLSLGLTELRGRTGWVGHSACELSVNPYPEPRGLRRGRR